ncbi:uncharacterized protein LOC101862462 [Aplysia californica]|uniref:Uncharacterized protein LOC101862462 n=1 Tax=Aplysia californica TaxID=6500 RepID=A0ABM0K8N0_APLCA|nr:uncharacterized protein LOC101862462 [Aplysia californica]
MRYCVAANCTAPHKGLGESVFGFPKDPVLRAKWIKFVRDKRGDFQGPSKYSVLCQYHFTHDCFQNEMAVRMGFVKKKIINKDAVPTIHRPPKLKKTETDEPRGKRLKAKAVIKMGAFQRVSARTTARTLRNGAVLRYADADESDAQAESHDASDGDSSSGSGSPHLSTKDPKPGYNPEEEMDFTEINHGIAGNEIMCSLSEADRDDSAASLDEPNHVNSVNVNSTLVVKRELDGTGAHYCGDSHRGRSHNSVGSPLRDASFPVKIKEEAVETLSGGLDVVPADLQRVPTLSSHNSPGCSPKFINQLGAESAPIPATPQINETSGHLYEHMKISTKTFYMHRKDHELFPSAPTSHNGEQSAGLPVTSMSATTSLTSVTSSSVAMPTLSVSRTSENGVIRLLPFSPHLKPQAQPPVVSNSSSPGRESSVRDNVGVNDRANRTRDKAISRVCESGNFDTSEEEVSADGLDSSWGAGSDDNASPREMGVVDLDDIEVTGGLDISVDEILEENDDHYPTTSAANMKKASSSSTRTTIKSSSMCHKIGPRSYKLRKSRLSDDTVAAPELSNRSTQTASGRAEGQRYTLQVDPTTLRDKKLFLKEMERIRLFMMCKGEDAIVHLKC